jgi:hypothetical protein
VCLKKVSGRASGGNGRSVSFSYGEKTSVSFSYFLGILSQKIEANSSTLLSSRPCRAGPGAFPNIKRWRSQPTRFRFLRAVF